MASKKNIPFVAAGSSQYKSVKQIDHDHETACRELTSIILMRGLRNIAILGGNENYVVNQTRLRGVEDAYEQFGAKLEQTNLFMNLESKSFIEKAVDDALSQNADCILCMDDAICSHVLRKLRQDHVKIPDDVKIASFYNSSVLENNIPSITSLSFDARELGMTACKNLLSQIDGVEVPRRTLLSYEVVLKESTK